MSDVRRFTPMRAEKAAFQQREVRSSLRRAIAQAAPWGWDPVKVGESSSRTVGSAAQKRYASGTRTC